MKELKAFDMQAHTQGLLDYYTNKARQGRAENMPGMTKFAWERVNELAKEYPEYYGDLPARLTDAMTEGK